MKRISALFLVTVFILSGCVRIHTRTVEKPRRDMEITGNQGYLVGQPTMAPEPRLGRTRKVKVIEFEFGRRRKKSKYTGSADRSLSGKKRSYKDEGYREYYEGLQEQEEESSYDISSESSYQEYIVGKNDTLQKISQKFYGTTKKWKFLYDVNQDVLKSPNRVYPGQKIKIPDLD